MKVIDLLNKIANEEEVPEVIEVNYTKLYWDGEIYWTEDGEEDLSDLICMSNFNLNRRVITIRAEKEVKKIQNINIDISGNEIERMPNNYELKEKINELIDVYNELIKEKE